MFDQYLSQTIVSYLRNFIQIVDDDSIQISLWQGRIVMKDLLLKPSALDYIMKQLNHSDKDIDHHHLGSFAFKIEYGRIGTLELNIPWKMLRRAMYTSTVGSSADIRLSAPVQDEDLSLLQDRCSILLSDLYMLVVPVKSLEDRDLGVQDTDSSRTLLETRRRVEKERLIQKLIEKVLLYKMFDFNVHSQTNDIQKSWFRSFMESMLYTTSVKIRHVDVRYEDTGTCFGFVYSNHPQVTNEEEENVVKSPFAFGIKFKTLSIHSTHEDAKSNSELFQLPTFEDSTLGENPCTPDSDSESSEYFEHLSVQRKRLFMEDFALYYDDRIMVDIQRSKLDAVDPTKYSSRINYEAESVYDYYFHKTDASHFFKRAFIIEPMSLTAWLTLSRSNRNECHTVDDEHDYYEQDSPNKPIIYIGPRVRMVLLIPSFRVNISSAVLTDASYLYQSLSFLQNVQRNVTMRKAYMNLLLLRPKVSPLRDPKGWWKYALQMVMYASYRSCEWKWQSWRGIINYVRQRRRYVDLYKTLLIRKSSHAEKEAACSQLMHMEDNLEPRQVATLRISVLQVFLDESAFDTFHDGRHHELISDRYHTLIALKRLSTQNDILSCQYRERYLFELMSMLHVTLPLESNLMDDTNESIHYHLRSQSNNLHIVADCTVLLQQVSIDIRKTLLVSMNQQPLLQLSTILVATSKSYYNGSKQFGLTLASTEIKNFCARMHSTESTNILGRSTCKWVKHTTSQLPVETVAIHSPMRVCNTICYHTASINFHFHADARTGNNVQRLFVRLSPMEVDCSVETVSVLTYAFSSRSVHHDQHLNRLQIINSLLLNLNYPRMVDVRHHRKGILLDVDLCSPIFVLPDESSNGALIVDFGRITLTNTSIAHENSSEGLIFDESRCWHVAMEGSQVLCVSRPYSPSQIINYMDNRYSYKHPYCVIEPFSLSLRSMKTISGGSFDSASDNQLWVQLNLSQLFCNVRTSSVRLLSRLHRNMTITRASKATSTTTRCSFAHENTVVNFESNISIISVSLSNDVDIMGWSFPIYQTNQMNVKGEDLVQLKLNSMHILLEYSLNCFKRNTIFDVSIQNISARDLYQDGGDDFVEIFSINRPDSMSSEKRITDKSKGLCIQFSVDSAGCEHDPKMVNTLETRKLLISVPCLLVEWNPETIALVQKAMRLSQPEKIQSMNDIGTRKNFSFYSGDIEIYDLFYEAFDNLESINESDDHLFFDASTIISFVDAPGFHECHLTGTEALQLTKKSFRMDILLNTVRINFNKEVRRRRLAIAHFREVRIHHFSKPHGGFKTSVDMVNFTLSDPRHIYGGTLYNEILGLKHDSRSTSSIFHLTFENFPRLSDPMTTDMLTEPCVHPNRESFRLDSCDSLLSLHFSPMRFVYLQQLWMEIIDYFFEGVIGYEIFGKDRPKLSTEAIFITSKVIPDDMRFLRFDIDIDAPLIVIPAMYRSPSFFSVCCDNIYVSNHFDMKFLGAFSSTSKAENVQLFNNCSVKFSALSLKSWCGAQLSYNYIGGNFDNASKSSGKPGMVLQVRWPVGASASRIVPKWDVCLVLQPIRLCLRPSDYSLFQGIIQHNIGEQSRYLSEWISLMSMDFTKSRKHLDHVLVNFGYDKKDLPSTTYSFTIVSDSIEIVFSKQDSSNIMILDCSFLQWNLSKNLDRFVKQLVSFRRMFITKDVNSEDRSLHAILRPSVENPLETSSLSQLTYSSHTRPDGYNARYLNIRETSIFLFLPTWLSARQFFVDLPDIEVFSPDEVLNSMQIGDRWYKIERGLLRESLPFSNFPTQLQFGQIENRNLPLEFQFRILLELTSFIFVSEFTSSSDCDSAGNDPFEALSIRTNRCDYLSVSSSMSTNSTKTFLCDGIEVHMVPAPTCTTKHSRLLMEPSKFGLILSIHHHTDKIENRMLFFSEVLAFQVSHLDLISALRLYLRMMDEIYRAQGSNTSVNMGSGTIAGTSHRSQHTDVDCRKLSITLIDDSLRHFSSSQRLIELRCTDIRYKSFQTYISLLNAHETKQFRTTKLEVVDHLQSVLSPFHIILTTDNTRRIRDSAKENNTLASFRCSESCEADDQISWDSYSIIASHDWGFSCSTSVQDRCGRVTANHPVLQHVIDVSVERQESGRVFSCKVQSLILQWNPSLVVATQSFCGRVRKRIVSILNIEVLSLNESTESNASMDDSKDTLRSFSFDASCGSVTLCLNKEHQCRRLLELTIDRAHVEVLSTLGDQLSIAGSIDDLMALDTNDYSGDPLQLLDKNKLLISVQRHNVFAQHREKFVTFEYLKNVSPNSPPDFLDNRIVGVPIWIRQYVSTEGDKVDDFLSIQVASLKLNFLRDRTAEIVDYLSNGLPGKGMGATSRAATGFIRKRIKTRSFLDVSVDSPEVTIPINRGSEDGIVLYLGDFRLKSWFDEATEYESTKLADEQLRNLNGHREIHSTRHDDDERAEIKDLWRVLSLSITRLGWHTESHREDIISMSLDQKSSIDVHAVVRTPLWNSQCIFVRASSSSVECVLKYNEYALIREIIQRNILAHVDMDRWDNIEKAYEENLMSTDMNDSARSQDEYSSDVNVQYVEHAKVVRYGTSAKARTSENNCPQSLNQDKERNILNLAFRMFGMKLFLHRDDVIESYNLSSIYTGDDFNYDILLLYVSGIEICSKITASGERILSLTFQKLGLFDLGDNGRRSRERINHPLEKMRKPSAFHVLAEGFDPSPADNYGTVSDIDKRNIGETRGIPQLQFTLNVRSLPEKSAVAQVFINNLNINPLDRSIREAVEFFSCAWPKKHTNQSAFVENKMPRSSVGTEQQQQPVAPSFNWFELNITAHYPTIFFLADETDPLTRSLVLRGRFVVKMRMENECVGASCLSKRKTVKAHLQSMESYINPNAAVTLEDTSSMQEILHSAIVDNGDSSSFPITFLTKPEAKMHPSTLGIALIEPVTALLEFAQVERLLFPTSRNISLYIEPLSTSLSFEDLCLIDRIRRRWTYDQQLAREAGKVSKRSSSHSSQYLSHEYREEKTAEHHQSLNTDDIYEVEFSTTKLGIILRKQGDKVVIDHIQESGQREKELNVGDEIILINREAVGGMPFQTILDLLATSSRPLSVVFRRRTYDHPILTTVSQQTDMEAYHMQMLVGEALSNDSMSATPLGSYDISRFNVIFKIGNRTGLRFVRSLCGNLAVVDECNIEACRRAIISGTRIPKPGAVVLGINGSLGIEYEEVLDSIRNFEELSNLANDTTRITSFKLTFLEAPSVSWGTVDDISIEILRLKVSLIDDINGRDMPLLRSTLELLSLSFQRAFALETSYIRAHLPFYLISEGDFSSSSANDFFNDFIVKGRLETAVGMDYYNSRISVWEPLLEDSPSIRCLFERQKGSKSKKLPGNTAFILSDYSMAQHESYICLNLTDAAIDILTAAVQDLRRWMVDNTGPSDVDIIQGLDGSMARSVDESKSSDSEITPSDVFDAQKVAADAALIFAQRHGREPDATESSKPFVLRNRTGLGLRFFLRAKDDSDSMERIFVGSKEIKCTHPDGIQVIDGEEARFSMDITEFVSSNTSKRVRDAEHFPFLNVHLLSPKPEFTIDILRTLPVMKIGSTIRRLSIHRSDSLGDTDEFSSFVAWTVSIESNRRIITISNAVSISSSIGIPIELGVRNDATREVEFLGTVSFDKPYSVPLSLDLSVKHTEILMRPKAPSSTPLYEWCSESILELNLVNAAWRWVTSSGRNKIRCQRELGGAAYISLQVFNDHNGLADNVSTKKTKVRGRNTCVILDSFLKLRNALPVDIAWETCHNPAPKNIHLDSSTNYSVTKHSLKSGECVDLIECDIHDIESLPIRFRCSNSNTWSSWTTISVRSDISPSNSDASKRETPTFEVRDTIIISAENEGTAEWTIGLKRSFRLPYGIDFILFSELWIANFTNLPLVFGAPKVQLIPSSSDVYYGPSAAESALLEISSILEFGERGKGLEKEYEENFFMGSDAREFGHQLSDEVIDEIFEYIEVSHSLVKRRWWAGERYDDIRMSPSEMSLPDHYGYWHSEDKWMIDCSGGCSHIPGGWESCQNLVGGQSKYFSAKRTFDANHPFRRRRWFRRKTKTGQAGSAMVDGVKILFHQPYHDWKARTATKEKDLNIVGEREIKASSEEANNTHKIFLKVLDGRWSSFIEISQNMAADGIVRILGSRWPQLNVKNPRRGDVNPIGSPALVPMGQPGSVYGYSVLDPRCYELSYHIATLDGPWGDLSKILTIYPRFSIENGSTLYGFDIKQSGAPDSAAVSIKVNEVKSFFWSDINLPELMCIRPTITSSSSHDVEKRYKWSGAFDIRKIGMIPLRIREESSPVAVNGNDSELIPVVKVVRASIEIRPGTGGTGVIISLNEECINGEGALYRIENFSPFPLWVVQDGVLANPLSDSISSDTSVIADDLYASTRDRRRSDSILNGDLVLPSETLCFGLDIPYRQGKYSWRDAASMDELTRVRIGLAPLSSRDGIETTKVIALSALGELIRLSPSKLRMSLDDDHLTQLLEVKVLGLVYADGPTKVLRFCLIRKEISVRRVLENTLRNRGGSASFSKHSDDVTNRLKIAASHALSLLKNDEIPTQEIASTQMLQMLSIPQAVGERTLNTTETVDNFSVEITLSGILLSTVDSVPSEIAVLSAKSLHFAAKWTNDEKTDTTSIFTVGNVQVDNVCPNSPFPVSLHAKERECEEDSDEISDASSPFLSVGLVVAPSHNSGMKYLKCVSIENKDIALAVDLAFIIRFQRFLSGLLEHINRHIRHLPRTYGVSESKETWVGPNLSSVLCDYIISPDRISSSDYMYFQALSVMPFAVKLSVAPANALTYAQALMEGEEAAAIHAAVRKGDVEIGGDSSRGIGVRIGGKNRTPLAVIHGVFKSILVDGLLRCDGASLNFPGVLIENHMSTATELKMYFLAHYLNALKSNLPALIGSLAAFGNPVGLIRGLGDGVTAFVREPVKGLKKSVKEMNPSYIMDGVARGTESLARHTFGGIVDSASSITETFSKNMAVLTLDRKYAQRRDQFKTNPGASTSFVSGVESGVEKLIHGVVEGVTGVVRAPIRGAERKGVEGFAKGVGKGLLGLVVKPVIGLSDAATDVMIGVKGTLESTNKSATKSTRYPIRPRRAFYTTDRILRAYNTADATAVALMMRTRLAGEYFLSHCDLGDRVAILSVHKLLMLGPDGKEQQLVKFKNIKSIDCRPFSPPDIEDIEWGVFIFLSDVKPDGTDFEVIRCETHEMALQMTAQIKMGIQLHNNG